MSDATAPCCCLCGGDLPSVFHYCPAAPRGYTGPCYAVGQQPAAKPKSRRFDYVKYDAEAMNAQAAFKQWMLNLEGEIESRLQGTRERSLALTACEVVYMWIGKSIKVDQEMRNANTVLQEERANE